MSPDQYCRNKAAGSGSSFYYSFLFLPEEKRCAITALYAFCREVDDVVDECHNESVARTKLEWWRMEIERSFSGEARHPVTRALQQPVRSYNLPQEYFQEVIDGMEMDLDRNRYESFRDLALYCHRAAGVVGLLSAEIFGHRNRATLNYAESLGTALQLTNIVRDVREDAQRGRIYLPLDELLEYRINPHDLLNGLPGEGLAALLQFQAERAGDYYRRAMEYLVEEDRYSQRSGLIMAEIYQTTLSEIATDGYRVMEHRIMLTPLRKFWIAWSTARRERRRHRRQLKHPAHA